MPSKETSPFSRRGERELSQPTSPRYTLASELIGSDDEIISSSGTDLRLVRYPSSYRQRRLFQALRQKQLVLGVHLPDAHDDRTIFSVPLSARPLAYEVSASRQGEFTYGDKRLFNELGKLMAITNRVTNGCVLPEGSITRLVAFVDFTEPDEHNLFLVPGIERVLTTTELPSREYYLQQLPHEMGNRFHSLAAAEFSQAFDGVMGKSQE